MNMQVNIRSSAKLSVSSSRHLSVRTCALFGWGKKSENSEKNADKDEQFRIQQELLAARRSGSLIKEANDRRRKVQETVAERKAARQQEKDSLAKGIIPDSLKDWKNYKTRDAEEGTSGIVIPLLPFGKKEYDEGERFDLRSPYADEGWVDPEETDMWSGLKKIGKKILNFSGNNDEYREQYGKPILWAKDYEKYKQERDAEKSIKNNSKKR
jgi:hypothetical protein